MLSFTHHTSPESYLKDYPPSAITPLPASEWQRLQPDRHFIAHGRNGVEARCSVWRESLPPDTIGQPAAIGHFLSTDAQTGSQLLDAVADWLRDQKTTHAIGPIDANTWNRYRLVTSRGTRPPFILEPWTDPSAPAAWEGAGFRPLAEFHSGSFPPQIDDDPRLKRMLQRWETIGLRIRNLDLNDFSAELQRIHAVSLKSFAGNFLYTPVSVETFTQMYQPIRDKIVPRFTWIAETDAQTAGYLFALPDYLQLEREGKVDAVVIKTLAIVPDRAFAGLGQWLTRLAHRAAHQEGYQTVIHALMHSGSRIKHFGRSEMDVFRRYTLYQRML
ncbi:MAG: hypothetical protein LAT58_06710 [Opitutales bacterium]|nr:hypothetical protein [Opitutales bacterium]